MAKKEKNTIGNLAKIFGIISISFQGVIFLLILFISNVPSLLTIVNVLVGLDGIFIMMLLAPAGIILSIIGLAKKQKGSGLGLGLCIPCLFLPLMLFAIENFIFAQSFSSSSNEPSHPTETVKCPDGWLDKSGTCIQK